MIYTGTPSGVISLSPSGVINNCLYGEDDTGSKRSCVIYGDIADLSASGAFSISAWYKSSFDSLPFYIINKEYNQGSSLYGWDFMIYRYLGDLYASISMNAPDYSYICSDSKIPTSSGWHNVIMTYDGSTLASGVKFYHDGSLGIMENVDGTLTDSISNDNNLYIGKYGTDGFNAGLYGFLDEICIFNKELNQSMVNSVYNGGSGNSNIYSVGDVLFYANFNNDYNARTTAGLISNVFISSVFEKFIKRSNSEV